MIQITDIPLKVLNSMTAQADTPFSVSLLGPRMLLRDDDSSPIGILHEQSAETLRALEIKASADLQIFCEVTKKSTKGSSVRPTKKMATGDELRLSANLYVVIYGPLAMSKYAGTFLQQHGIYLQDPLFGNRVTKYCNPHRLCQLDDDQPSVDTKRSPEAFATVETPLNPFVALENATDLPETGEPVGLATRLFRYLIFIPLWARL